MTQKTFVNVAFSIKSNINLESGESTSTMSMSTFEEASPTNLIPSVTCTWYVKKMKDDFKRQIQIQEAATNKLIMADSMSNERPKLVTIESMFKGLFKK